MSSWPVPHCAACNRELPGPHLGVEIGRDRFLHVCPTGNCASRMHETKAAKRWRERGFRKPLPPPGEDRRQDDQRTLPGTE